MNEIEDFQKRTFVIDCPAMQLTQEAADDPIIYQGPGSIFQQPDGSLQFKLFHINKINKFDFAKEFNKILNPKIKIGEIHPVDSYYSLRAVDISNKEWTSARVKLSRDFSYKRDAIILSGKLKQIKYSFRQTDEINSAYMILRLPKIFELPCNIVTEKTLKADGKILQEASGLGAAKFLACGYHFFIRESKYCFKLEISSIEKSFPPFFDIRVSEALQFIFSKTIDWIILERWECNGSTIIFRPQRPADITPRKQPPLRYENADPESQIWQIFEKYLSHILPFTENKLHFLSAEIKKVIAASAGSVEAEALTVSVSVEGILNKEFKYLIKKEVQPKEEKKKQTDEELNKAIQLIENSDLSSSLKKRIRGSLDAMANPRAVDILYKLGEYRIIDENLISAWKKIRNPSAHSTNYDSSKIGSVHNNVNSVHLLFNLLIFLAIGYTGQYTDFSSENWPIKKFNAVKPAKESRHE